MVRENRFLFLLLSFFTVSLGYLMKELLNTDILVNAVLAENITTHQLNEIMRMKNKINWVGYAIIPVILLIKIGIISATLWAGCSFFDKKINYRSLFNIAVKVEFIFLPVIIFKTIWFYFFYTEYTLEDIQCFYPLSLLNIIGYKGLEPWYVYPLQVLNLFELIYWLLLIYLLARELNIRAGRAFNIVAGSYGIGLLIWVIAVMFLAINVS